MASKNINVLMSLVDNFSAPMQKCSGKMSDAEKQARRTANAINGFGKKMNSVAISAAKFGAGLAAAGYAMAVAGIKQMADQSVEAAKVQLMAETQLEATLKNVTAITERGADAVAKATAGLKAYAGELQNAGVIGDEVTLSGMSQLAMYQMTDDQIKQVSAGMLDLLAKQKGLNATQEDAVAVANAIGKAYAGDANALSRLKIKLTEAEQNAIKFGDANQRTAAIAQILQSRVGGVNAALAKTDMGRQQQAMNAYGDMLEEIGKKLIPMKAQLWGVFGAILPKLQGALLPVMDKLYAKFEAAMPQIERMAQKGVFVAHCPNSNTNISSGIAPVRKLLDAGIRVGLGSDVAGGHSLSLFDEMVSAVQVSNLRWRCIDQNDRQLSMTEVFYMATRGGGEFFGKVGSFDRGYEFDALVVDDCGLAGMIKPDPAHRFLRSLYLSHECLLAAKYVKGNKIL